MLGDQSLQDKFLRTICLNRIAVSIFLVNGIKLQGHLESFDKYVIVLRNSDISGEHNQMIFKHAISTIMPLNVIDTTTASFNK